MTDELPRLEYRHDAAGPLAGVRVLDLSRLVAGNMATHLLADFGAEVLKVEDPAGGDSLRGWRVGNVSTFWNVYARNKKSLGLDIRSGPGRAMLLRLAARSQVIVENFIPGKLEQFGIGPSTLFEANPNLVILRISGFGQTGPASRKPGFGTMIEALAGFAFQNGYADRPPLLPPIPLSDMVAGLSGAAAVMIALRQVEVGGGGISDAVNHGFGHSAGSPPLDVAEPIARLVRNVASGRRILVACEDLDSFDTASLQLLPKLLDALAGEPVLVVATSRRRLRLSARGASPAQHLRLGPLREGAARSMLDSLCSPLELDAEGIRASLRRAGGNPLFLEEVAALAKQGGAANNSPSSREFSKAATVPDRVESLIVDRLARLRDERRQVLRIASVMGYDVSADLLQRLVGIPRDRLDRILARLQAEHLLVERSGLPHRRLSFRHALTREVAYKSLLRGQRQTLHAEVTTLLEAEHLGDPAHRLEELCYHTARGGLHDKAMQYLQAAAGVAADRGAPGQATDYLSQALEIAAGLADADRSRRARIEILLGLRVIAVLELRYVDALGMLDEAERLATELDDHDLALTIRTRRLRPLNVLGRLLEAVHTGEELRKLSRAAGNWPLAIEIAHDLGQAYFELGDFRRAEAVFSEVSDVLDQATPTSPIRAGGHPVTISATRAAALAFLGRFREASAHAAAAIDRAVATDRSYDIVYARFVQGFVHLLKRELPEAVSMFEATLEQAESHGVRAFIPSLQCGLGHALLLQGASDPAVVQSATKLLDMARDTATERRREIIRLWATLALGMASLCAGLDDSARQLTAEAVELGKSLGMRGFLVLALRGRGLALAAGPGGRQDALDCLLEGLRLARRLGMPVEAAHILVAINIIRPAQGGARLRLASATLDRVGLSSWRRCLLAAPAALHPRRAF